MQPWMPPGTLRARQLQVPQGWALARPVVVRWGEMLRVMQPGTQRVRRPLMVAAPLPPGLLPPAPPVVATQALRQHVMLQLVQAQTLQVSQWQAQQLLQLPLSEAVRSAVRRHVKQTVTQHAMLPLARPPAPSQQPQQQAPLLLPHAQPVVGRPV